MTIQRVTKPTVEVLVGLLSAEEPIWGLEISRITGLMTGTVYPILDRLEEIGWVQSSWEDGMRKSGPRRRLYVLTDIGIEGAIQLVVQKKAVPSRQRVSKLRLRGNEA